MNEQIEHWNQRFSREDYLFGKEPNAFLVSQAQRFSAGMRVLSVADGEGRNGVWLAQQGVEVLAVEGSLDEVTARLEEIRAEIVAERVSWGELAELQSLARFIGDDDILLLEWAGVPEGSRRS